MRWAGHVARIKMSNLYKLLVGKLKGKTLGRPRWEDNIKVDLKETVCGDMNWILLPRGRVQWSVVGNMAMHLRVP
jgi:hypothetical protein